MNINQLITIESVPLVPGQPWAIGASWRATHGDITVTGCSPIQALERLLALLEKRS